MNNIIIWALYQIPEAILIIYVGLGFLRIKVPSRVCIAAGVMLGTFVSLVRLIPIPFGYHIPLTIAMQALITMRISKCSIGVGILSSIIGRFALILGESLVLMPLLQLLKMSVNATLTNSFYHILFGWVSALILVVSAIAVKAGVYLFDVKEEKH